VNATRITARGEEKEGREQGKVENTVDKKYFAEGG
jgi:hypothetical protein